MINGDWASNLFIVFSSKLICKLTGDTVNKSEEHIWKHINGKRFLNKLGSWISFQLYSIGGILNMFLSLGMTEIFKINDLDTEMQITVSRAKRNGDS